MKQLVALLLLSFTLAAQAGQRFSFAGLVWGDSLAQVEQKLQAAGHSSTTASSAAYWVPPGGSRRDFNGKVAEHSFDGTLIFLGDRLSHVLLSFPVSGSAPSDEIHKLFLTRYGKPRQVGPPSYDLEWVGSQGERLRLSSSVRRGSAGAVTATYDSPEAVKARTEQKAKDEAAARLERRNVEAKNRLKAAGL